METKDLIEFVNNPNFIPGIHNYCDRWCERCPLSSRCSVYAIEREEPDDPEARDINNKKFWEKLACIFQQTKEMITQWCEEQGIDLSSAALEPYVEEHERRHRDARSHPLCAAGEAYAFAVSRWFDDVPELATVVDTEETRQDMVQEADSLEEAFEVIQWYQFFIAVKTMRGVLSHQDEIDNEWEEDGLWKDSDGSIKIALIAIDRSISAWRLVQMTLLERAESTVPLILSLERLRLAIEQEFPNARDFIRPGFDEITTMMVT